MATKKTHGGKRKGSGRKATGRKSETKSISMLSEQWEKVDKSRGNKARGKWIGDLVDRE
jgi:hypothetical protein